MSGIGGRYVISQGPATGALGLNETARWRFDTDLDDDSGFSNDASGSSGIVLPYQGALGDDSGSDLVPGGQGAVHIPDGETITIPSDAYWADDFTISFWHAATTDDDPGRLAAPGLIINDGTRETIRYAYEFNGLFSFGFNSEQITFASDGSSSGVGNTARAQLSGFRDFALGGGASYDGYGGLSNIVMTGKYDSGTDQTTLRVYRNTHVMLEATPVNGKIHPGSITLLGFTAAQNTFDDLRIWSRALDHRIDDDSYSNAQILSLYSLTDPSFDKYLNLVKTQMATSLYTMGPDLISFSDIGVKGAPDISMTGSGVSVDVINKMQPSSPSALTGLQNSVKFDGTGGDLSGFASQTPYVSFWMQIDEWDRDNPIMFSSDGHCALSIDSDNHMQLGVYGGGGGGFSQHGLSASGTTDLTDMSPSLYCLAPCMAIDSSNGNQRSYGCWKDGILVALALGSNLDVQNFAFWFNTVGRNRANTSFLNGKISLVATHQGTNLGIATQDSTDLASNPTPPWIQDLFVQAYG